LVVALLAGIMAEWIPFLSNLAMMDGFFQLTLKVVRAG